MNKTKSLHCGASQTVTSTPSTRDADGEGHGQCVLNAGCLGANLGIEDGSVRTALPSLEMSEVGRSQGGPWRPQLPQREGAMFRSLFPGNISAAYPCPSRSGSSGLKDYSLQDLQNKYFGLGGLLEPEKPAVLLEC